MRGSGSRCVSKAVRVAHPTRYILAVAREAIVRLIHMRLGHWLRVKASCYTTLQSTLRRRACIALNAPIFSSYRPLARKTLVVGLVLFRMSIPHSFRTEENLPSGWNVLLPDMNLRTELKLQIGVEKVP